VKVQDCDLRIEEDRAVIEANLCQLFDRRLSQTGTQPEPSEMQASEGVRVAMREAVFGGGKRIRPLLAIRVARLLKADMGLALKAAAAVELVHCASLVIDDLPCMDNASLRRGGPPLYARFGEPRSILAAFALVALAADSVVAEARDGEQFARLVAFQRRLLQTLNCDSLIGGEAWDLTLSEDQRRVRGERLASRKTAPLFELAVAAGAVSADVPSGRLQQLTDFARSLALLFQGVDDLMDAGTEQHGLLRRQLHDVRAQIHQYGPASEELGELVDHLVRTWAAPLANTDVLR
jgi:geranylgeranyl diphosphate synthase type II